ncbi:MAG TPA: P-loop NTPase, partial [Mycobacterium sp.]|nr:P-loop NTPase [Mycobacterium sp.]
NMSGLAMPDGTTMHLFGEGGGARVADQLTRAMGRDVPLLGQVPIDTAMVSAGDAGTPVVLAPDSVAGKELRRIADGLATRGRGLVGMSLSLDTGGTQR